MTPQFNKKLRLLIADDLEINRYLLSIQLKKFGFNIDFVNHGKEVLEHLRKQVYDVILLDLHMPVLDGMETARIIRTEFEPPVNKIPILAVSTFNDESIWKKCLEVGINDYISKPYKAENLYHKIIQLVPPGEEVSAKYDSCEKELTKADDEYQFIDLNYLEDVSEGNITFMVEMIDYFIANVPSFIENFKQNIIREDWDEIHQNAHKFASQLAYMGINSIVKDTETIENLSKQKKDIKIIKNLAIKIEKVCICAINELKLALSNLTVNLN